MHFHGRFSVIQGVQWSSI